MAQRLAEAGDGSARAEQIQRMRNKEIPVSSDALAYIFHGEGKFPFAEGPNSIANPHTTSPEATKVHFPLLKELVQLRQQNTTGMSKHPTVVEGHRCHCDPELFALEKKLLFQEGCQLAGLSLDVGTEPWDYWLWKVPGGCVQPILLFRDETRALRAFENHVRPGTAGGGGALVTAEEPVW